MAPDVTWTGNKAKIRAVIHHAYHVLEDEGRTGPHSLAVLRQKAEVHALHPCSRVRPVGAAADAAWTLVRDLPELHAHLFPGRQLPRLGSVRFESANTRADASTEATDVHALLRDNTARQLAAETAAPPKPLAKIGARRRRDFWLLVVGANGAASAYIFSMAGFGAAQVGFLIVVAALVTTALHWMIFQVMDPY